MLSPLRSSAFQLSRLAGRGIPMLTSESLRPLSTERRVEKVNWKHDVVYLYQYPRTPYLFNLSPFCLKLETFLRANRIKHEVIFTYTKRSTNGKLPFIELNGEQVADSQVAIWRLQKQFNIQDHVQGADRGAARALERMVDMSTHYALMLDKVVNNSRSMLARNVSGVPAPAFVTNIMAGRMKKIVGARISSRFDKLTPLEIKEVLNRDVQAIADVLGDKKFLFGDRMTVTDCVVFGHLASTYYLPYRQQITDLLDDEYPNVKAYIDRIRAHYFQDWKLKEY